MLTLMLEGRRIGGHSHRVLRRRSAVANRNSPEYCYTTKGIVSLTSSVFYCSPMSYLADQVTLEVLKQARKVGVPAIWIQPGASDAACVNFINENGMDDHVLWQGECLWRDGDGVVQALL